MKERISSTETAIAKRGNVLSVTVRVDYEMSIERVREGDSLADMLRFLHENPSPQTRIDLMQKYLRLEAAKRSAAGIHPAGHKGNEKPFAGVETNSN